MHPAFSSFRRSRAALVAGLVLVLILTPGCSPGSSRSGPGIAVSGNIEVTDAELGFKLPGRVIAREVDEGEPTRADQVIARIEAADLEQEAGLRRAEVAAARAVLAELEAGTRPEEIARAEASLALAEAEAHRAELDYARQKSLAEQSVITARDLEFADTARRTSAARVREAKEQLTLLRNGPRREELDQARARLRQAEEALGLAETRLSYTTLKAPFDGLVLAKHVEPGEYVAAGTPVVTVGDLAHPWLRGYISETDLGRVKCGQPAEVTTDTYPGKVYPGRVSFIASQAEFTPKNVQTPRERVKLVYRVKIDLENPQAELKPGMPADARILTDTPGAKPTP